jgi:hypothetical protein
MPESGTELAVAKDVFHRGPLPVPVLAAAALPGAVTSRLVTMNE